MYAFSLRLSIIKEAILAGKPLKIGSDQDWVLAKLTHKWLKYYNTIFDDNLKPEDITSWRLSDFVKPEAKDYVNNILNLHKFYRDLEVVPDSQRVLKEFHDQGHEIFIATDHYTRMSFKSKNDWLIENYPFLDKRNFIFTGNKAAICLDFLIDDGIHNCEGFQGIPLLYDAPHNQGCTDFYRVRNWQDIEYTFKYKLLDVIKFYEDKLESCNKRTAD